MKKLVLCFMSFLSCVMLYAQEIEEYQDPAYWIDLEQKKQNVPVSIVPLKGQLPVMYSAPIKFIPQKNDKLSTMDIKVGIIKYEFDDQGRKIVHFNGQVDLLCCRNRPVNMEFYDDEDNLIQFARTDEDGVFKLKSVNGNLLELKNYKLKINFKKVKTIDENWDERYASLERLSIPDEKKLIKMRKKYEKEQEKIKNKNGF